VQAKPTPQRSWSGRLRPWRMTLTSSVRLSCGWTQLAPHQTPHSSLSFRMCPTTARRSTSPQVTSVPDWEESMKSRANRQSRCFPAISSKQYRLAKKVTYRIPLVSNARRFKVGHKIRLISRQTTKTRMYQHHSNFVMLQLARAHSIRSFHRHDCRCPWRNETVR
jgi:hypothetical protein